MAGGSKNQGGGVGAGAKGVATASSSKPSKSPSGPALKIIQGGAGTDPSRPRRRVPRRDFDKKIGLLVRGQFFVSHAVQIGEGGMMIKSPVALREGQKVVITFKLPNCGPDVVMAEVRYIMPPDGCNPVRYGLEFINLDFKVKRDVRSYVASQTHIGEQPIVQ